MKYRIALLLSITAVGAASLIGVASAAQDVVAPQKVTVLMYDFRFKLSKPTLKPGKYTFTVINRGRSIHDFDIVRVKNMPFIAPGKTFKFTVTLKAGTYRIVCTVPRHDQLGMAGKLIVK